ncbi:MAG: TauD/TfdA family dioxygenase [Legionellaceae bacterium]|nr:TauD/TfdA family dioxygenase [Legionellaceae bacterium]
MNVDTDFTKRYNGVEVRLLKPKERLLSVNRKDFPIVFEATNNKTVDFLNSFLEDNSEKIMADITTYGAILFRGFAVESSKNFEDAVLSIQDMQGISQHFMPAPGRTHVGGTKYVLHTSSIIKTGGTCSMGVFHHENYNTCDVASYISFCCLEPSKLGGETGLVDMSAVYDELNSKLKQKLESSTYFVRKWRISIVAKKYKISRSEVRSLAREYGLPVVNDEFIYLYKPSILVHPISKKKSFHLHFNKVKDVRRALIKNFAPSYLGWRWVLHRIAWRFDVIYTNLRLIGYILKSHQVLISFFKFIAKNDPKKTFDKNPQKNNCSNAQVDSIFKRKDSDEIARLMRKNYSSFLWRKGDILIVDNILLAHSGMPGFGRRKIRAMISNPLAIDFSYSKNGVQSCGYLNGQTLGEKVTYAMKSSVKIKNENLQ